ncbi:MAG TPA: OmpA family protein [Vicinamibacteria bacterium]|nr:OmpA family protein [Vicinamibacteria bacterium]
MKMRALVSLAALLALGWMAGCGGKSDRPPATTSGPPRSTTAPRPVTTPSDVNRIDEGASDDSLLSLDDPDNIHGRTLEQINENSPLEDVRFEYDSAVLSDAARATLDRHAEWLSTRYPNVTLLIEGHCDERGTVEYNLALGERRASAVFGYLVSLGINSGRLKTISYGKEFPLDPGHDEAAWGRNRRAHFELTGK